MNQIFASYHLAPAEGQPDSDIRRSIRLIRRAGLNILNQALTSPYVSAEQRERARLQAENCPDIHQIVRWHGAVVAYVAAMKAGLRQAKPEQQAPEQQVPEQLLTTEPTPGLSEPQAPAEVPQSADRVVEQVVEQATELPAVATPAAQPAGSGRSRSTNLYRPARRMSGSKLHRLRVTNQARRDAQQQQLVPTPMWQTSPRLTALPGGLYWSGSQQVPGVGQTIMVSRPGGLSGTATVKGYFHAEGFLGVVASFDKVPARLKLTSRSECVFGRELALSA